MLKISDNRRFIVDGAGRPFFYLADTAWELFHRLTREEADLYLANRAAKRFTTIQAVALAEFDGLNEPNAYADRPLLDNDPTRPDEKYWQHVDYIVKKANELGLYITLLPTWGDKFHKAWGKGPEVFTPANARIYGNWIAKRYANSDVIWMLGGDRPLLEPHLLIVRAMAEGIRDAVGNGQLITFHPCGGETSSTFVGAEPWLDFNTTQSGHVRDRDNYNFMERDYRRLPTRPVLDSEPGYEDHPNSFNPEKGWLDQHDIRKSLYWSVFAGACGYTYGCHDIWQMLSDARPAVTWARTPWKTAIDLPAACQLRYCRELIESRPYLTRIPDAGVWGQTPILKSDAGTGADHVHATRDADSSYAMVYIPSSQRVTIDMSRITGGKAIAWWYNPRTGQASEIGVFDTAGNREFYTPATDQTGRDWVLVLDDATRNYGRPGRA